MFSVVSVCPQGVVLYRTLPQPPPLLSPRSQPHGHVTYSTWISLDRDPPPLPGLVQTFYCPQRSWGKVIFSQVSVILLTGGMSAPGGVCSRGVYSQWGVCLLPRGVSAPGGICFRGCLLPGGVCFWGGVCSQGGVPGGDPPLERPLLWAVRILLKCILVYYEVRTVGERAFSITLECFPVCLIKTTKACLKKLVTKFPTFRSTVMISLKTSSSQGLINLLEDHRVLGDISAFHLPFSLVYKLSD